MNDKDINIVIPMAGNGQRFIDAGYTTPKFLINILGKTMIEHATKSLGIDGNYIYIVQKEDYDRYNLEHELNSITPNCKIITIENKTDGAARTTLFAEHLINNDQPLIIFNSDQIIKWNVEHFKNFLKNSLDGAIVTFKATGTQWSYVKMNELGLINEVAEKKQISNDATAGIYYWSKGLDYVYYVKQMINKQIKVNNEFYVAPVYNEAIMDNKKILSFSSNEIWNVGTPDDLEFYIRRHSEN
jgi:NDP-sugar pyrophosphorylase family protein